MKIRKHFEERQQQERIELVRKTIVSILQCIQFNSDISVLKYIKYASSMMEQLIHCVSHIQPFLEREFRLKKG